MSNPPTTLGSRSPASGRHGLWRLVGALARAQRALLVVVVLGVVGAAVAGVVPPLVVRHVVNTNVLGHRASGLWWAGVIYVGAVAARSLCSFVYNYAAALAAQRMIVVMRVRLFTTLASVATSYLDATPIGDTISRATSDVETIDTLLTDGVTTLVGQLVALVAVAFTMIVLSPTLSAVSFVVLPPLVLASRWLQRHVRASERATRVAVGELNAQLSESVGGRETIRAFDRTETFVARFRAALARTLVAQETSVRYGSLFTPVSGLLSSLAIAALLWVGSGALIAHASTNLGTLTAFVLLFQGFFAPIVALGDQWNAVQAALAGAERVLEVLELPVASPPSRATAPSRATGLVLRDVSFAYPGGEPVLRGVSVSVAPGERVALVGRTGSGKSTLLALAVGLYEPSAGEVLLLGGSPVDVDESRRRRALGVVPQRVQLFSGSLRDNVTLLDESIDDEAVRRALSLVGLDAVLASLPEGLDTVLVGSGGGEGLALSAGERQLVALARALVVPPAVLVLDEATATVDASSDAAFQHALSGAAWSASCAVLTVAHRISTARGADRVVVLDAGRVVEEGTPATLIARGGRFASLVDLDEAGWDWSGHPSR